MIRIENWAMGQIDPKDVAGGKLRLKGEVYNHPRHDNGKTVTTSSIVDLDMKSWRVKTRSGSEYHLGKPSLDYVEWLEKTSYKSASLIKKRFLEHNNA